MKSRSHQFLITITMDKKCTARVALREAKNNIHGEHYCYQEVPTEPEAFRVRSIKPALKPK